MLGNNSHYDISLDNLHTSIEGYTDDITVGRKSPWLQPQIGPMTTKWQIVNIDHMLPSYTWALMQWHSKHLWNVK